MDDYPLDEARVMRGDDECAPDSCLDDSNLHHCHTPAQLAEAETAVSIMWAALWVYFRAHLWAHLWAALWAALWAHLWAALWAHLWAHLWVIV